MKAEKRSSKCCSEIPAGISWAALINDTVHHSFCWRLLCDFSSSVIGKLGGTEADLLVGEALPK